MSESKQYRPRKPAGLSGAGARLWEKVTAEFGLETNELAILEEMCRMKVRIDELDAIVADEGLVIDSPQGRRIHPAGVEVRQARNVFNELAKTLKWPGGES